MASSPAQTHDDAILSSHLALLCRHRLAYSVGSSMPKMAEPKPSESQREQAYQSLRRLLVLQQVQPGQRLREPEWAERIRVHRSALREAFARLEAEGLVERGAQTGYFVPKLTVSDVLEVTKLRLALESLAIDEVCAQAKPALAPLKRAVDEF